MRRAVSAVGRGVRTATRSLSGRARSSRRAASGRAAAALVGAAAMGSLLGGLGGMEAGKHASQRLATEPVLHAFRSAGVTSEEAGRARNANPEWAKLNRIRMEWQDREIKDWTERKINEAMRARGIDPGKYLESFHRTMRPVDALRLWLDAEIRRVEQADPAIRWADETAQLSRDWHRRAETDQARGFRNVGGAAGAAAGNLVGLGLAAAGAAALRRRRKGRQSSGQ